MTYRGKFFFAIVSALITFYAFSGVMIGWFDARAQQPINDSGAQIRIFESVLQHIQNDYVDEPNLEKVRSGALRGLAYGLDPYSAYLTAEQVKEYKAETPKNEVGIGAEFSQFSSYIYVVSVLKGSPAEKAGLRTGDSIEYIDGKATSDISLYDSKQLINGAPGTAVKLKVLRARTKPRTITVTRGGVSVPKVSAEIKSGNVGVVKLYSLADGQAEIAREQIKALNDRGVRKLILDLRNVAFGEIDDGVSVANAFIKDGEIAKVIGRENKTSKTYSADAAQHIFDGDVVTLVDFGTAGAAEVVAAAMIDRKRGEVVGERTFGAGTQQDLFMLRGGDGLLLTTQKWASPSGKTFLAAKRQESGVKPTEEIKRPNTPEPIEAEDLGEPEENLDGQPPAAKPTPAPPVKQREDLHMKRALELLQGKAKAAGA